MLLPQNISIFPAKRQFGAIKVFGINPFFQKGVAGCGTASRKQCLLLLLQHFAAQILSQYLGHHHGAVCQLVLFYQCGQDTAGRQTRAV